jgi:hypothetical protein
MLVNWLKPLTGSKIDVMTTRTGADLRDRLTRQHALVELEAVPTQHHEVGSIGLRDHRDGTGVVEDDRLPVRAHLRGQPGRVDVDPREVPVGIERQQLEDGSSQVLVLDRERAEAVELDGSLVIGIGMRTFVNADAG